MTLNSTHFQKCTNLQEEEILEMGPYRACLQDLQCEYQLCLSINYNVYIFSVFLLIRRPKVVALLRSPLSILVTCCVSNFGGCMAFVRCVASYH